MSEDVSDTRSRAQRDTDARKDARTSTEAERAEGVVSASMLRLAAVKRDGEFPYKMLDGRIDVRKTIESLNPLVAAVAILAEDPTTPTDVIRRVVPMIGAIDLLGLTLREVHATAKDDGLPDDTISVGARYAAVVRKAASTTRKLVEDNAQRFSDWSSTTNKPDLSPAALTSRLDAAEKAIDAERPSADS